MNLVNWLERTALKRPDSPALLSGTEVVADYREFARRAAAIAGSLSISMSIRPGDRIAIFAQNSVRYLEALYGIWYAGAVAVPVNAKLHAAETAWIIEDAGAKILFCDVEKVAELAPRLSAPDCHITTINNEAFDALRSGPQLDAPVLRNDADMAWLFYTSGTTGKPKGVMLSHGNLQAMALTYFVDVDVVSADDAILYAAPISHGAGIYNFQHVLIGARHVLPPSGGFEPVEIFDLAAKLQNVHIFAAPTMVRRLTDVARVQGESGAGIKTIVYGGGPMYLEDIVEAVEVLGPRFCQIYGQGESPMTITALPRDIVADRKHPRWKQRLTSVGTAQSCVDVSIADENGMPLPVGTTGEILVRGAPVMAGYWNNPEATADALRNGWLWTGDMGSMDEDGYLTLKDRSKDVIISGGSNIYPREIEEVLLHHPCVREVSVVGKDDPGWGEVAVAFVAVVDGQSVDAQILDAHCLDHIARFKRPKEYLFIPQLPKNNYGKVLKTELRQMLQTKENKKNG
ncbi:MAG: long-chain fatty acid--CoA ligase [Hyphomicrobiales bacterium]|nr:long-chain fatty acid--CoA ligase [Hyphomicrobiales bacterium]MCP4999262.1 long-chain fatty acid--CoA ligase [Hyphomicrobiales bacterium]